MSEALNPCPFCGNDSLYIGHTHDRDADYDDCFVACGYCFAEGNHENTEELASSGWNRVSLDCLGWRNLSNEVRSNGLKPCPFCGGEVDPWEDDDGNDCWYVECRMCGAIVRKSPKKDEAIEDWWNRRAGEDETP